MLPAAAAERLTSACLRRVCCVQSTRDYYFAIMDAAAAAAPARAPAAPTPGARLRALLAHANVSAPVFELAALVSDYIDGEWLPDDAAVPERALALARRLLAYETENATARAELARLRARAAEAEAQVLSLVADDGGTARLRAELAEARAAHGALLAAASGESFARAWESHAGALAEEAAALRTRVAALEAEAVESAAALAEARRAAPKPRAMAVGFDGADAPPPLAGDAAGGVRSRRRADEDAA